MNRREMLGVLIGIVAPAPMPEAVQAASVSAPLQNLADGVYCRHGVHELMSAENAGGICNIAVIVGNDAVAVIDSGGSVNEAKSLIAEVSNVTDKPIRYLINTHMHPDHVFGNAAFRDIGATIVGHHKLPLALAGRADQYLARFRQLMGEEAMRGVEIVPPSLLVDNQLTLDLGGRKLELQAWAPAHTDNDLTAIDSASGILCAGDLVFTEHVPTLDGSIIGWIGQRAALRSLPATQVIPGHGQCLADWPGAMDALNRYLDVLAADIRKSIAAGQSMTEAIKVAGQSERKNWRLFDEYHERNVITAFAELEWE